MSAICCCNWTHLPITVRFVNGEMTTQLWSPACAELMHPGDGLGTSVSIRQTEQVLTLLIQHFSSEWPFFMFEMMNY